jgi:Apea-like HEPN
VPEIGAGRPPDAEDWDEPEFPEMEVVRDVLVIPSPGHQADPDEWMEHPEVDEAVDLGNGVMLERLRRIDDDDLAEQVIHASLPRGLNFEPTRQFGQLYSFWREIPEDEWNGQRMHAWDPTRAIVEAVAISRLVLDNGHSYEFAGRVFDRNDGRRRIAPLTGFDGRTAYRARKSRFWFTEPEAFELRRLLDRYRAVKETLPDRVERALGQAERSAQSRYITDAVAHIATGLEALLNTNEDEEITKQFVKRSRQLADELGIEGTSNTYWNWVYTKRSEAVHGAESTLVAPGGWYESDAEPPADVRKIAKAQDVLRAAIRRAIEDNEFRAVFVDDDAIAARWPLEQPSV